MKYKLIENSSNDINHFIKTVLQNRGITNIQKFMESNEEDLEQNSFRNLNNINEGVELLLKHIKNKSNIALVIDPDVDGITSSAILVNYLVELCESEELPPVNWIYVTHSGKGHGFSPDINIPENIQLIITPDGGSNDYEEHKKWKDKGVDILVLDHHIADKNSEDAVVINNQLSEEYTNKAFSGVGIVYRFLQALDDKFFTTYADNYLDLVALGNISDIMDTSNYETRYFIQQGILRKNLKNPFLKILVKKTGAGDENDLDRYIYPIDVSFKIAPIVNALLRLGTVEEKNKLFECFISPEENLSTRKGICKEALNAMQKYKETQDEEKQNYLEKIDEIITEDDLNCPVLVLDATGIIDNNEIIGLTAMNLASKYKRPVILGNEKYEGSISGSVRVNNGFPDVNFKDTCEQSKLFTFTQGHQQAFGHSYQKTNKEKIKEYFRKKYGDEKLQNEHTVDFIIDNIKSIAPSDFFLIQNYKNLWGKNIEEPSFVIENVPFFPLSVDVLGKKNDTIKYNFSNIDLMFFKCSENDDVYKLSKGDEFDPNKTYQINIVGKLGVSNFAGRKKNQIIVDDYDIFEVKDDVDDFCF